MPRYIDADALMEMLNKKAQTDLEMGLYNHGTLTQSFIRFVERQPTADVAPRAEWISVEERLPEQYGPFLIADDKGNMEVATWTKQFGWFSGGNRVKRVTHWMPLPVPPKGAVS